MIDFEEQKQKQERGVTVKGLLENALEHADDAESIVIVTKQKDDVILTGYSWENAMEALGMLDIGKTHITDRLREY